MTTTLQVVPLQYGSFEDIDAVEPINDDDAPCLEEIREVLKKHGKRERFGVALLHTHFPLDVDEVMVEYTDKEQRVQTIKPVKKGEAENAIGTIWMLADGDFTAMQTCYRKCDRDVQGNHQVEHGYP